MRAHSVGWVVAGLLLVGASCDPEDVDAGPSPADAGPIADAALDAGRDAARPMSRCALEVAALELPPTRFNEVRTPTRVSSSTQFLARERLAGPLGLYVNADGVSARIVSEEQELDTPAGTFVLGQLSQSTLSVVPSATPCERTSLRVLGNVTLRGYPGAGPAREQNLIEVVYDGPTRAASVLVGQGDPAPGTTDTYERFGAPTSTPCGVIAFGARLTPSGTQTSFRREPDGVISRVVGVGDTMPGSGGPITMASIVGLDAGFTLVRVSSGSGESLHRITTSGDSRCLAGPVGMSGCAVTTNVITGIAWTDDEVALTGMDNEGRAALWAIADIGSAAHTTLGFETDPAFRVLSHPAYCPESRDLFFVGGLDGAADVWALRADGGALERVTDFNTLLIAEGVLPSVGVRQMSMGPRCWAALLLEADRLESVYMLSPDGRLGRGPWEGDMLPFAGGPQPVDRLLIGQGGANTAGPVEDGAISLMALDRANREGIFEARWPEDDCVPTTDVNSLGDAPDSAPGDGACDTGARIADGSPECTLRAAIQETNALDGGDRVGFALTEPGPRVIAVASPLPDITDALEIDGEGALVVLNGANAGAGAIGLACFHDAGCAFRNLELREFAGDAVFSAAADLTLESVRLERNCGWGVYAEGAVSIESSFMNGNGAGMGCSAGGVYAASNAPADLRRYVRVQLSDTTIRQSGGPGVLTSGNVVLERVDVSENRGDGVSAWPDRGSGPRADEAIRVQNGRSQIVGNTGHGLYAESRAVRVDRSGALAVAENAGWGVFNELSEVSIGSPGVATAMQSDVSLNGLGPQCETWELGLMTLAPEHQTEPCVGGGVFAGGRVFLEQVTVDSSFGPGVLARSSVRIEGGVQMVANGGSGIAVLREDGASPSVAVSIELPGARFESNGGYGIEAGGGDVLVADGADLAIFDNGAGGIDSLGSVRLGASRMTPPVERSIGFNGGGASCRTFSVGSDARPRYDGEGPCPMGAGIRTERDASVFARHLVCQSNAGDGVETGDVDLEASTVCDNGGVQIDATGTSTLVDVIEVCP